MLEQKTLNLAIERKVDISISYHLNNASWLIGYIEAKHTPTFFLSEVRGFNKRMRIELHSIHQ